MCNVYEQAFRAEACTLQWAKQQGFWAIRAMGSKMFNEVVQELVIFWIRGSEGRETPDLSLSRR